MLYVCFCILCVNVVYIDEYLSHIWHLSCVLPICDKWNFRSIINLYCNVCVCVCVCVCVGGGVMSDFFQF